MTTRRLLTILIALLMTLNAKSSTLSTDNIGTDDNNRTTLPHRGVGCWRGISQKKGAAARRMASPRRHADNGMTKGYYGQKRGLVILAGFTDTTFRDGHDAEKYSHILNTPGYTTDEGFRGSAADYFHDQSNGLFSLTFDVVGPFTTSKNSAYYGENDKDGYDLHAEDMIIEMCKAADDVVDFNDYDWDGDGEVDEVFVAYAGMGEADTKNKPSLIWPHMWDLDSAGKELSLDGVRINVYACGNELAANGTIEGIGTFCHEFSHCLGLPDFYDTIDNTQGNMDAFDVMDGGLYRGDTFCPVGYTAYEKMVCGWQQPIVLSSEDVYADSIRPISEGGDTYIIYNDAHPNEFYMIENRQKTGWDEDYPEKGLLITHIDYDEDVWLYNIVNSIVSKEKARMMDLEVTNDHKRMTFFRANKSIYTPKLYPFLAKDSLTASSDPAATLFNANVAGTKFMLSAITDITQHKDGTISFCYRAPRIADAVSTPRRTATEERTRRAYTLDGRVIDTDATSRLRHGIYIIDGRKVVR